MDQNNDRPALGLIIISVIMVFMAILTDIYWLASWIGRPFPRSIPLPEEVARAFALPDVIGSFLMYLGAYGLLRRRLWAIFITLVAIGMNFGSSLFFLSLTRTSFLNILGPIFIFILFTSCYLWIRLDVFLKKLKEKPDMP